MQSRHKKNRVPIAWLIYQATGRLDDFSELSEGIYPYVADCRQNKNKKDI